MKKITELKSRNLRQDRNSELVRRMRNGESLTSFNSQDSWFPPRPVIEKDPSAIKTLYGRGVKAMKSDSGSSEAMLDAQDAKLNHLQLAE